MHKKTDVINTEYGSGCKGWVRVTQFCTGPAALIKDVPKLLQLRAMQTLDFACSKYSMSYWLAYWPIQRDAQAFTVVSVPMKCAMRLHTMLLLSKAVQQSQVTELASSMHACALQGFACR